MQVEHYPPEGTPSGSDSESVSQEENKKVKISGELAALGIYALSMKPGKNWLKESTYRQKHPLSSNTRKFVFQKSTNSTS